MTDPAELAWCTQCGGEFTVTPTGRVKAHLAPHVGQSVKSPKCPGAGKNPVIGGYDVLCTACGCVANKTSLRQLSKHRNGDGELCPSKEYTLIKETLSAVEVTPSEVSRSSSTDFPNTSGLSSDGSSSTLSVASNPPAVATDSASSSSMLNPERPTETLSQKSERIASSPSLTPVSPPGPRSSGTSPSGSEAPLPTPTSTSGFATSAPPTATSAPPSSAAMFGDAGMTVRAPRRKRQVLEGRAAELASQMKEVWWASQSRSERTLQTTIGPSEVGEECMRRLAMKLSGLGQVNHEGDPWAAWVGTAMHSAYEIMFTEASGTSGRWITETRVEIGSTVVPKGTADLFDRKLHRVIDHKNLGKSTLSKTWLDGPSEKYKTQLQVYGYGLEQMGEDVQEVALVGWPREGNTLDDLYAWVADYDRDVAIAAIRRIESIAKRVAELGEGGWRRAPKTVSFGCKFCPFYLPGDKDEAKGCSA